MNGKAADAVYLILYMKIGAGWFGFKNHPFINNLRFIEQVLKSSEKSNIQFQECLVKFFSKVDKSCDSYLSLKS